MDDEIIPVTTEVVSTRGLVGNALQNIMSHAEEISENEKDVEIAKSKKHLSFVELAEEGGFSAKDLIRHLKDAMTLATEKKDIKNLTELIKLSYKTFLESSSNIGDKIIKLTQTQINLNKGGKGDDGGDYEPKSVDDVKRLLSKAIEDIVNKGPT